MRTRRRAGDLALVLHSHMPYVEGFGTYPFGEEWLFDAVGRSYLPLLEVVDRLTLSVTPVLADQLEAPGVTSRLEAFLGDLRRDACEAEARLVEEPYRAACAAEAARYDRGLELLDEVGGDVLAGFRRAREERGVELIASAASHAVLPLLATAAGRELQVRAGLAAHGRRFGAPATVFWLPECAYEPGLERTLAPHGVEAFCVDQTDAHGLGAPEQLEPVATEAGPIAVPVDWQAVALVWDAGGYPAHPAYRDYHRATVHGAKPWANGGGPYDPAVALELAHAHGRDFARRAAARLGAYRAERGRPGLLCCGLDAELLGHWWYEGRAWLAAVLAEAPAQGIRLATLSGALERVAPVERPLAASSWGRRRDLSTWDCAAVAEQCFGSRRRELELALAARRWHACGPALERAARELLAMQASDWAFLASRGLAGDYPRRRVEGHAAAMDAALAAVADGSPEPDARLRNLAPGLDLAPLLAP